MGAMDALVGNGQIGGEFLADGGALGIGSVDRLGAAIGLDAGKEEEAAFALDRALKPERARVGDDLIRANLAAERVGDGDGVRIGNWRVAAGVLGLARMSRHVMRRTAEFARVPSSIEAVICAIISS